MGGADWEEVLRTKVTPILPSAARAEAERRINAFASLPLVEHSFGHGDLAGSNIHWNEGAITGVLDWDLATYEDPAEDLASLAWWHGWDVIDAIAPHRPPGRAEAHRDLFPLQMVAFRILNDRGDGQLEQIIDRVTPLLSV